MTFSLQSNVDYFTALFAIFINVKALVFSFIVLCNLTKQKFERRQSVRNSANWNSLLTKIDRKMHAADKVHNSKICVKTCQRGYSPMMSNKSK